MRAWSAHGLSERHRYKHRRGIFITVQALHGNGGHPQLGEDRDRKLCIHSVDADTPRRARTLIHNKEREARVQVNCPCRLLATFSRAGGANDPPIVSEPERVPCVDIRMDGRSATAPAQAGIYREAGACPVRSSGL